jgi:hypothetical protein
MNGFATKKYFYILDIVLLSLLFSTSQAMWGYVFVFDESSRQLYIEASESSPVSSSDSHKVDELATC